jgi:hypothetical protein
VLRASFTAERAGIPAVSIIGELFEKLARLASLSLGVDEAPLVVYPGRIMMDDEETFRRKLETSVADQIVAGLTTSAPRLLDAANEPEPRDVVFSGSLDEVQEYFHDQLWTDGLAVIPPTVDRVERFLEFTSRDPETVLGVLLPEQRQATVWNVAVNGVMAGCRPEYMPVLLAVVEAVSDPVFRLEDGGSGGGWEPLITVSGPILKELDFNAGTGVRRIGRRANSSIGRFLRLYIRNVAGQRIPPGEHDKGGIGNNFNVVLAEDEATVRSIGWPTYGDDLGVPAGRSAVTVQGVVAESAPFGEHGGESDEPLTYLKPLVEVFGKAILGHWVWTGLTFDHWDPTIILSPHAAKVLAEHGWTKDDVRAYLHSESKLPLSQILRRGYRYSKVDIEEKVRAGLLPPEFHESNDPDRLVSTFVRPEAIRIVVAGNPDMYWQRGIMNNFSHGAPVTKLVT